MYCRNCTSVSCCVHYECPKCKAWTSLESRNIHSIDWCISPSYILRDVIQSVFASEYQQRFEETQPERVRWNRELIAIGQSIKRHNERKQRRQRDLREREKKKFSYRISTKIQDMMQYIRSLKWNPVVECIFWLLVIATCSTVVVVLSGAVLMFCGYFVYLLVTELIAWLLMMIWSLEWLANTCTSMYSDALTVPAPNPYLQYNHSILPRSIFWKKYPPRIPRYLPGSLWKLE